MTITIKTAYNIPINQLINYAKHVENAYEIFAYSLVQCMI